MKLKKLFTVGIAILLLVLLLAACGGNSEDTNDASGEGESSGDEANTEESVSFRLAHNQPENHPIHLSLEEFTNLATEKSDGNIEIQIHPNGQLGAEREVIESVKAGTLEMAKVSAGALEAFEESYKIFSLPYLFESEEHYYDVMDNSETVKEIYNSTEDDGFIAIGWYTSGQRSIYTVDQKVETPDDMKGLKIRVQESPTSIAMIEAMGGSPTPMAFGDVYTSLQSGILDGAENNENALTQNNHGEVAKAYSYTEHQFVPDILIINSNTWNGLSDELKQALIDAAEESKESHKDRWAESIEEAKAAAEEMGVEFFEVDKQSFIDAAAPLHEEFVSESDTNAKRFEDIKSFAQ